MWKEISLSLSKTYDTSSRPRKSIVLFNPSTNLFNHSTICIICIIYQIQDGKKYLKLRAQITFSPLPPKKRVMHFSSLERKKWKKSFFHHCSNINKFPPYSVKKKKKKSSRWKLYREAIKKQREPIIEMVQRKLVAEFLFFFFSPFFLFFFFFERERNDRVADWNANRAEVISVYT